ncbi:uncharacterized protein LOC125185300 [Salvia hispanica]|uniref:uncharacterized protein LOC125185300 n=1 Tax=Salvia hispanica TaxID=49212 RepID=UPI002008F507|nr:uncharacterized protein LOC125185300 [Salvia hispanica]
MEHESFTHMCHEHPLSRISLSIIKADYSTLCHGCRRNFIPGDATYGCSLRCGFPWLLHKECMEMPREIMHPIHPSHLLTLHGSLTLRSESKQCAVCEGDMDWYQLRYGCSHEGCNGLLIHIGCAAVVHDKNEKQPLINHPSHPHHQLRFSKKSRWCPFPCDACGATEKGDSYICTLCDYSIHESCALLPLDADFPSHHPTHSLSLAFSLPPEYIKYEFDCAICNTTLPLRRWVYHCNLCRYVVHINCAISTLTDNDNEEANAIDDENEATKFPVAVEDMYEEMIKPFVKRQQEQIIIPRYNIGGKYCFSKHPHHLLTFTTFSSVSLSSSSSSSHDHYKSDEDDEDDFDSIPRRELICDGCTLAIHEKKQTDGDGHESGYMSCDECKYFLHLSCFNLPLSIPYLPIHPFKDHNLTLKNANKLTDWVVCFVCYGYMNGLYYACTNNLCWYKIDIKCASLPNTIKHAGHVRHNYLKLVSKDTRDYLGYSVGFCVNCNRYTYTRSGHFKCNSCRFSVCCKCVMLPATNKHRLENHLLPLTYDAYVNRPGEFYCSNCECHIGPRSWMYHCRDCDQSFHPKCFPATSGEYKNIKFGTRHRQVMNSNIHDHPLRFQIITNKKRCDLCRCNGYDMPGFQCGSCFFVVCKSCGLKHIGDANEAI